MKKRHSWQDVVSTFIGGMHDRFTRTRVLSIRTERPEDGLTTEKNGIGCYTTVIITLRVGT